MFISPRTIAELVVDDLATGARQFVVQLALLMIVVASRVVAVLVDAEDDRDVLALRGGADDHLLRAGVEVGPGLVGVGEDAGRLEDDVDAEVAPRQRRRVLLLEHLDLAPVNDERVVGVLDGARIGAVRRVVLEQQRVELGRRRGR